MGQSETGYLRHKWASSAESIRLEGRDACKRGVSSAANPYLIRQSGPDGSGASEAVWFQNCDAWWRGWDDEYASRKHRLGGESRLPAKSEEVRRSI